MLADADLTIHIPDSLPFTEASTLGMGVSTAAQALYQTLQLPLPGNATGTSSGTILIYGGSTATGSLAIQFAKLQVGPFPFKVSNANRVTDLDSGSSQLARRRISRGCDPSEPTRQWIIMTQMLSA